MGMHATATEERAVALLGSGLEPTQVAAALGVTPSTISQLMSSEEFATQVSELRYKNLAKHNERDSSLDSLEDAVIKKLSETLPFVMRPMELTRVLQVVNAAKRRGQSTPESIIQKQNIVNITLPSVAINKFVTNAQNQVVQSGGQSLITMQSGELLAKAKNDLTPTKIPIPHRTTEKETT